MYYILLKKNFLKFFKKALFCRKFIYFLYISFRNILWYSTRKLLKHPHLKNFSTYYAWIFLFGIKYENWNIETKHQACFLILRLELSRLNIFKRFYKVFKEVQRPLRVKDIYAILKISFLFVYCEEHTKGIDRSFQ